MRRGKEIERLHITVDLEFFEDTHAYQTVEGAPEISDVGFVGTQKLLDIFKENNVKATFFVVSRIAEKHPDLVKGIEDGGHEIASHSVSHSPEINIFEEAKKSKTKLEEIIGEKVKGFRAPSFLIEGVDLKGLSEIGYEYDSSLIPCIKIPGWYGGKKTKKSLIEELKGYEVVELIEKPPSVNPYFRLPISGFWIRLFGLKYTKWSINKLVKKGVNPIIYLHPWELVTLPRIEGVPRRVYFRTGKSFENSLREILGMDLEKIPIEEEL